MEIPLPPGIEVVEIEGGADLKTRRTEILDLFEKSFGRELQPDLWQWAFLSNPCGPARVVLAYQGSDLVGHYAAIPQRYAESNFAGQFWLSMTTMVHPSARRKNLFVTLGSRLFDHLQQAGALGILGFPNESSAHGFEARLGWSINRARWLTKIEPRSDHHGKARDHVRVISAPAFCEQLDLPIGAMTLDLKDPEILSWRLAKPGANYECLKVGSEVAIIKQHGQETDLVFSTGPLHEVADAVLAWSSNRGRPTINCYASKDQPLGSNQITYVDRYSFGFRSAADHPEVTPQLLCSDVF